MNLIMTWFPNFFLQISVWVVCLPVLWACHPSMTWCELMKKGCVGLCFILFLADTLFYGVVVKNVAYMKLQNLFYLGCGLFGFDVSKCIHKLFGFLRRVNLQKLDADLLVNIIHVTKKMIKK